MKITGYVHYTVHSSKWKLFYWHSVGQMFALNLKISLQFNKTVVSSGFES